MSRPLTLPGAPTATSPPPARTKSSSDSTSASVRWLLGVSTTQS